MNLEQARFNMIEQQVRPWSVLDSTVLQTMGSIPRDIFVPETLTSMAYADIEIPLDHGESMMHPRVEGRMLQELEIDITDECLEVGTGSGYVTACMATMAKHVDSIDIYDSFLENASDKLSELNISNVNLENKDALKALTPQKKYDVIAVTGSVTSSNMPMFEELLKPNGRLFIVVGSRKMMHAMKISHENNKFVRTTLFEAQLKPLVGIKDKTEFTF